MKSKIHVNQLRVNSMSKKLFKLTVVTVFLCVFSCKNETQTVNLDYKYSETENVLNCKNLDTKLFNEALLSFEDDIMKTYNTRNSDVRVAYTTFFRATQRNGVNYQELVSPHTMEVFEALKSHSDLWTDNNQLNYNAEIFTCIGDNIQDKGLATTYKALISTNSMRADLFGAPLQQKIKTANTDRYLATFMALDLFYSKLFDIDPTQVKKKENVDNSVIKTEPNKPMINQKSKSETKETEDAHAGHNHD